MGSSSEGKGLGYALIWGFITALFMGLITAAGVTGALHWWIAAALDVALGGGFAWLMLTAQWD